MSLHPLLPHNELRWTPIVNPEDIELIAERLNVLDKISLIRYRWSLCCSNFCCPISCFTGICFQTKVIENRCDFFKNIFTQPGLDDYTRRKLSLLPPEREEMEVLEKKIYHFAVLDHLAPYINAVNRNRGLFDITYEYLDPQTIRNIKHYQSKWYYSKMSLEEEAQIRRRFTTANGDIVYIHSDCCHDSSPFF